MKKKKIGEIQWFHRGANGIPHWQWVQKGPKISSSWNGQRNFNIWQGFVIETVTTMEEEDEEGKAKEWVKINYINGKIES